MSELIGDKTYKKYLPQWELYKEAHNGYAQYLSYELHVAETKLNQQAAEIALYEEGIDAEIKRCGGTVPILKEIKRKIEKLREGVSGE